MMSGKKGMTHYSLETKLQLVQLHEGEGLTYNQSFKFGVLEGLQYGAYSTSPGLHDL